VLEDLFGGFEDLSGTFTVADVALSMLLSFALCAIVGLVYRTTHVGISYSQSYVQTLVMMGMIVSVIMLVVGSNLARAFALVGALSIIRFRNAIKETRDVGFIFFAMAIGMATGTRFYSLAVVATFVIAGAVMIMQRFDWYKLDVQNQIVKIQVPGDGDYTRHFDDVFARLTTQSQLVSLESIRGGALAELMWTVKLRKGSSPGDLVTALQRKANGQKVTVLTGYDRTDL
jgi:uncharacterized membrane protein YhiD involved in acid resistance